MSDARRGPGRRPLHVVSPHLDDAVLSAGALLAAHPGSVVTTVFAGDAPAEHHELLTEWDRASGMAPGADPVAVRREEDRAALGLLGATPHWLGFVDSQYGPETTAEAVAAALADDLRRAAHVVAPLGLWHSDHLLVADACLLVFDDLRATRALHAPWWLYADVPYRSLGDGACLRRRLDALARRGLHLEPVGAGDDERRAARKARAVARYPTQLRALRSDGKLGVADAAAPEQFWRLDPARP